VAVAVQIVLVRLKPAGCGGTDNVDLTFRSRTQIPCLYTVSPDWPPPADGLDDVHHDG
jgi:hypothetical protein